MKLNIAIAAALIGTFFAASANAKPAAAPSVPSAQADKPLAATPAQHKLGIEMVGAINSKSTAAYRRLILPEALTCFNSHNQLYFDEWMSHQMEFPVPGAFTLGVIKLDNEHPSHGLYLHYRVPATHYLSISYLASDGSAVTLNRPIVQQNGKWYADIPCPTALEMKRIGEAHKKVAAAYARASKLYPKLKDPLKAKLAALLAKGDVPQAWKTCSKSMHVDIYTARALVSLLTEKDPNLSKQSSMLNFDTHPAF